MRDGPSGWTLPCRAREPKWHFPCHLGAGLFAHAPPSLGTQPYLGSMVRLVAALVALSAFQLSFVIAATVALFAVSLRILNSGTNITLGEARNVADLRFSVSPVMKVAVKPKDDLSIAASVAPLGLLSVVILVPAASAANVAPLVLAFSSSPCPWRSTLSASSPLLVAPPLLHVRGLCRHEALRGYPTAGA